MVSPVLADRAWLASKVSLVPECINLDLTSTEGPGAIRELHEQLCRARTVREPALLLYDLLQRHALGSSCIDAEVAMPHARTFAVDDFALVIGRSAAGVAFDTNHRSVRLVVLVVGPAPMVQEYLRCTVLLVNRLRNASLRRELFGAVTREEFCAIWNAG